MKKILTILICASLLNACAKSKSSPSSPEAPVAEKQATPSPPPAVASQQKSIEPLVDYTGYWQYSNGDYKNVIQITTEAITKKDILQTRVLGLDFYPDFGYRSTAFADKDNPLIEYNINKAESLLVKTLNKKREVISIRFNLHDENTLEVVMSTIGKTSSYIYTRMSDLEQSQIEFRRLQNLRAQDLLQKEDFYSQDNCLFDFQLDLSRIVQRRDLSCVTLLHQDGKLDIEKQGLIQLAVENRNLPLLKQLILWGGDVNSVHPKYGHPFDHIVTNSGQSFLLGEHGWVAATGDTSGVFNLLYENGADINKITTNQLKSFPSNGMTDIYLKILKDSKFKKENINFKELFSNFPIQYHYDFVSSGSTTLRYLFSLMTSAQIEELNLDPYLAISSMKSIPVSDLEFMKSQGFKFPSYNHDEIASDLNKELETQKELLQKDEVKPFDSITALTNDIHRLEQTIEWWGKQ